MPEMSVIVVNWNGKHLLETCLTALRRQTFRDFETILVDNGSMDGSVEYISANFLEVEILRLSQNRGFAAANIVGYDRARGDLIVLLNNDTEAEEHWLEEMSKASRAYPKAGSFASKMLLFDERNRIDICGFDITAAGLTIDLGHGEQDGPEWSEPRNVFGACAGAAAYRRRMLEDVGFFDADFFGTYEDGDLSFRAQLRGYECIFVPGAIAYHRLTATMKKYPERQAYLSQRNVEFLYLKNMPLGLMISSLPQRVLYELGACMYFFKKGAGKTFLKAKFDAVKQLPAILRKRKEIQARRTVKNAPLRARMRKDWLGWKWKKFLSAWRGATDSSPLIDTAH
jgi:GT2 family glycosyltransferase